ncbi:MAG: EI24 domain-containing protein [Erythrobacter sp.]
MSAVFDALAKALGQLSDPAVLRVLAKSMLVTLAIFAVFGVGLFFGLTAFFDWMGWADGGIASAAAAVLIAGIAGWLLFRVVAVAVLQFFADEIVIAVEEKHYPQAARSARKLPFTEDLANSLRGIGRTLGVNLLALPAALVLLVTGIGPAVVFLGVNSWLLGRELTDMAWLRHRGAPREPSPVPGGQRVLLGLVVAAIMLVPFANFIAPVLGAAAGTHLTHRRLSADHARLPDA